MEFQFRISARKLAFLTGFVVLLSPSRQIPGSAFNWGKAASFHILFKLLFTNHPIIRRYTIIVMSKSNPNISEYVSYILYALIWPHEWQPR